MFDRSRRAEPNSKTTHGENPDRLDWKDRWASLARLGCASDVVESDILRLRALEEVVSRSSAVTDTENKATSAHEQQRACKGIVRLDETLGRFSTFMDEIRSLGFTPVLVGQSFSDPLYQYLSSSRRLADFGAFREEAPLDERYKHLHAKLFCQEVDRYVDELQSLLRDPTGEIEMLPSVQDIETFVEMIHDPFAYLQSSEWIAVIHVCKGLVDAGVVEQSSFLQLVKSLVARSHQSDATLEVLSEATSSLRGALNPDMEEALYKLGEALAEKRQWGAIFERPFLSSHPIVKFGYCAELLHRLVDFSVEDPVRIRELLAIALRDRAVANFVPNDSKWYQDGITRMQSAIVKIMDSYDPEFAVESLHAAHRVLWGGWDNLGDLWVAATHGIIFGSFAVQHAFLRYILADSNAVASLKGILSEATTPLGATYQLVGGLRQILRERRQGILGAMYGLAARRALELLAYTGHDGVAAAPEVLGLLGISAFRGPLPGSLISPPWPCIMDRDLKTKQRARALIAQWEKKHGPFSPTITKKLARYDALFAL